jgi:hypothetical protein
MKIKKYYSYIVFIVFLFGFLVPSFLTFYHESENHLSTNQVELAVTVDGISKTQIPDQGSGKAVSSIVCDKGANGVWDYQNWTLNIKNMKETRTRCQINFVSKYTESVLNGTDPVLKEGLIPVVIEDSGKVKKASLGSKWYSYGEKKWANAIILNDASMVYADGEEIPESNIESYFVWIPRYRYQIFNDGKYEGLTKVENREQEIEVVFETNTTAKSNGTSVGQWLTHPAFTSFDTNGMWVGKFMTGYKGSTNKANAQKNAIEPGSVQIKPNVNSWRNIQVANAFYTSYDYKREMNSHMMKNTEWGAVAYLHHSKYGSMSSVRINNNLDYLSGYAAVNEPTCGNTGTNEECNRYGTTEDITKPYNTSTGYLASTTGNISGIYDMSGGSFQYMMGVMIDQEGKPMSGGNSVSNSGFNGKFGCPTCDGDTSGLTELTTGLDFPSDARYYDCYPYFEKSYKYDIRILGDATGEMGPFAQTNYNGNIREVGSWYGDEALLIWLGSPWVLRSGGVADGTGYGIFTFLSRSGQAYDYATFRIVLNG